MGGVDGQGGVWAYVEGGMGSVSDALANCARSHGATIFTSKVYNRSLSLSRHDAVLSYQSLAATSPLSSSRAYFNYSTTNDISV